MSKSKFNVCGLVPIATVSRYSESLVSGTAETSPISPLLEEELEFPEELAVDVAEVDVPFEPEPEPDDPADDPAEAVARADVAAG